MIAASMEAITVAALSRGLERCESCVHGRSSNERLDYSVRVWRAVKQSW